MTPWLYFASGSNHAGEIQGFGAIGQHVGVAAPEVNEAAIEALLALPSTVHVFVDSGAFSEVAFGPAGPKVVKPIPDAAWARRLALYARLSVLGPRLHVVAPDRVGDQEVTLARMRQYALEMRQLVNWGVDVLVPLQQGRLSLIDFERAAADALGLRPNQYTPAIPSKKDATPTQDVLDYARVRQPRRMHLLGLGIDSPRLPAILEGLERVSPGTVLTLDSNRITASVGRDKPGGRKLTAASDYTRQREVAKSYQDDAGGYTDLIGDPAAWLSVAELRKVGTAAGLAGANLRAWLADPSTRPDDPRTNAALDEQLDLAWEAHAARRSTTTRKAGAVEMAFGDGRTARGIVGALYTAAARDMMRPGTRTYHVVEYLDTAAFRAEVEAVVARVMTGPPPDVRVGDIIDRVRVTVDGVRWTWVWPTNGRVYLEDATDIWRGTRLGDPPKASRARALKLANELRDAA